LGYGNRETFPLEHPSDVQAPEYPLKVEIYFKIELIGYGVIHFAGPVLHGKYYINV
jgi:hypothetical protein